MPDWDLSGLLPVVSQWQLDSDNVRERNLEQKGQFLGYLPHSQRAEFQIEDSEDVLTARVALEFETAGTEINRILEHPVIIQAYPKQVGSGCTSYVILGYDEVTDIHGQSDQ